MKIDEFDLLHETTQVKIVSEKGVFLAERKYLGFIILLYQVDGFYVEFYFCGDQAAVQGFKSFDGVETLDAYLDDIDISELVA